MTDELATILENHLVIEDPSLRDSLLEILNSCQRPKSLRGAIVCLDALCVRYSSSIGFLDKVPYCCLFLSYPYFKGKHFPQAIRCANLAIDGFDQRNHVWNRSVARWICALIYKGCKYFDEAEQCFDAAAKLMVQDIQDHKRRSRYEKAEKCEAIYSLLLQDARDLRGNSRPQKLLTKVGEG